MVFEDVFDHAGGVEKRVTLPGRGESRHLFQVELELPDVGQESCVVGFVSIHEKEAPVNALGRGD